MNGAAQKKAPPSAEPDLRVSIARCQRPNNSHNRMITGIGTPSSQSKIPRPIIASMKSSWINEGERGRQVPASGNGKTAHQCPVFGIEAHGSAGGLASPFCSSSIECRSGERTKAIWPSRGGRLMVMPSFIRRSQVA
jgi:hypothetical protein